MNIPDVENLSRYLWGHPSQIQMSTASSNPAGSGCQEQADRVSPGEGDFLLLRSTPDKAEQNLEEAWQSLDIRLIYATKTKNNNVRLFQEHSQKEATSHPENVLTGIKGNYVNYDDCSACLCTYVQCH